MRALALAAVMAALSSVAGRAETINFSPEYENSTQDGNPMRYLRFRCGPKKILLYPPKSWEIRGTSNAAYFSPQKTQFAEAKFENAPSGMPAAFDEKGLEGYRQVALSLIPRNAKDVIALNELPDAVTINNWTAFEKTHEYTADHLKFTHSILFLKLDAEREIRIQVTARNEDFAKFHRAVLAILNTWFEE